MVQIKLKWNKQTFDGIELETSGGVPSLKRKIFELTGVPADRQKLMAKGAWIGTLKDDADLTKLKILEDQQVLLMGTADELVVPKIPVVFFEDLTAEEKAVKGVAVSSGLINLGNTCYMNSTIQCIRHMPEVRAALGPVRAGSEVDSDFSATFRDTLLRLDATETSIPPSEFVSKMRRYFPQFAQQGDHGHFMQQDAEEFYNVLVQSLSTSIATVHGDFDSIMNLQMEEHLTCQETDAEPLVVRTEKVGKLVCNIQGGSSTSSAVDHLQDGIRLSLEGSVEKFSEVLGRNALWKKHQRVASLPQYLCVHFMRFFWKATPDNRDHTGLKCKILRPVTFPETFDPYDFCAEGLQRKLRLNRDLESKRFNAKFTASQSSALASSAPPPPPAAAVESSMVVDEDAVDEEAVLQAALALSVNGEPSASASASAAAAIVNSEPQPEFIAAGLPRGFTGTYELHSIVSHKGRSADSGHYIGWVRQAPGADFWWKYDDDRVSEVGTEEILQLKGGGDRDLTYLVFYRFKDTSN